MERHTQNYLRHFKYDTTDTILCEVCGSQAVDIHHIQRRSTFGKKKKEEQDDPKNLIALCRECHEKAHLRRSPYLLQDELQRIHNTNTI